MTCRVLIAAKHNDGLFRAVFNAHSRLGSANEIDVLTCKGSAAEYCNVSGISTLYVCEALSAGLRQLGMEYNSVIVVAAADECGDLQLSSGVLTIIQAPELEFTDVHKVPDSPRILRVEATNRCSARCRMCPNRFVFRSHGHRELSPEGLEWDFLSSVKDIVFLQNGEFTEALYLREWLRVTSDVRARLHVTTNGSHLTPNLLNELVEAGLSSITFSIDSTDPVVFRDIRYGSCLERVLEGLDGALGLPCRARQGRPIVQVNITLQRRNVRSLTSTCKDLAARGVDAIHIEYARIYPENVEAGDMEPLDSLYFDQELADACIREAMVSVQGFACELSVPPPFEQQSAERRDQPVTAYCWQPLTDVVVWGNGDVTPCVGAQSFILGNIHTAPLHDIRHGTTAEVFRSRLLSGDTPDECKECICGGRWNGRAFEKDWHLSDL